ncbi:phosphoribosylglycinamide synthetase [Bifidobacteriaceae bacterium NR026]|nr:phosphoribosylglycinamide synthetase [Bifidobacteriaceae bacterium NR026]
MPDTSQSQSPKIAKNQSNENLSLSISLSNGVSASNVLDALDVAAERLSIVRYVFLVQIEDGIASASQRSSLEYADAVLMGWPDRDNRDVVTPENSEIIDEVNKNLQKMESNIAEFSKLERASLVDNMSEVLVEITECVANIRGVFQPDFDLPTFEEIKRVVQDEWNEEMGNINPDKANVASSVIDEAKADDAADASNASNANNARNVRNASRTN